MKICIVSPFAFGPSIAPRLKLASLLAEKGHEIFFFTSKTQYMAGRNNKEPVKLANPPLNVSMHYIDNFFLFPKIAYPFVNPISEIYALYKSIKDEKIQLIHFYQPEFFTTLPLLVIKKLFRIPTVLTINGIPGYGWKYGVKWVDIIGKIYSKLIISHLIKQSDYILLYSSQLELILKQMGFSNVPCEFIPESIDLSKFINRRDQKEILRKKYGLPQKSFIIMFSGRLAPVKRIDILISAFSRILNKLSTAFLLIVGDGPSREELMMMAQNSCSGRFMMTGFLSHDEVSELYSCSDIFVLISHGEGFSASLLEACASGLPCIVSDVGANADIVKDGYNGAVLKNISPEEIATITLDIYPKSFEMGTNSRERILSDFSWPTLVDRYEDMYEKLIEKSKHHIKLN